MKKLALGISVFVVFMLTLLAVVWFNLGLILNEKTVSYAKNKFNLPLSWKELEIDITNLTGLRKNFLIRTSEFCLQMPDPQIQICFANLEAKAQIQLIFGNPYFKISDIFLEGSTSIAQVVLKPSEEKNVEAQEPFWPSLNLPSFKQFAGSYLNLVDRESIQSIHLEVPKMVVQKEDLLVSLTAKVHYSDDLLHLENKTSVHKSEVELLQSDLKGSLSLLNPELKLKLNAKTESHKTNIESSLHWGEKLSLDLSVDSKKFLPLQGKFNLSQMAQAWRLNIDSSADLEKWNLGKASLKGCPITADLSNEGKLSKIQLSCDLELLAVEKLSNRFLPSTVSINLKNQNDFDLQGNSLNIKSQLNIQSSQKTLIELMVQGASDISLSLKDYSFEKISIAGFEALVKIEKVKSWQEIFKKNSVPLPAPLNALDGPLELKSRLQSPDLKLLTSQTTLTTNLQGEGQKLITDSNVDIDVDLSANQISLKGNVFLNELAFDLPYIGLEAPPQIVPDNRFKGLIESQAKKPSKWKFNLQKFTIQTPAKPIIIKTRLLNEPVPLRINYVFEGSKLNGNLGLDPFALELFNKKFQIAKFNVVKHAHSEIMDLDGELNYRNSEVKVSILVIGTTSAPKIEFLSDPQLSREQIISVILFNKSLNQITNEDKQVAGQMNQALLADAFGIFSLLFLSKTPIESIYYDPISKSYTARVKLDDQTSLSLGSNFDTSQQFQLRRRLGGPWSVVTELQKSQSADDTITTLIEWFKRF